jgi:calcineurin-like phosphoesterase family protein
MGKNKNSDSNKTKTMDGEMKPEPPVFFKMPKLTSEGILLQQDALDIYRHYLSTPRLDYNGQVRKPTRSATFKAMCGIHAKNDTANDVTTLVLNQMKEGKRVLFWSDLHFFHNNIIRYCERPFDSVEQMNSAMLKNYYHAIKDDDLVIFGGDVAFSDVDKTKALLQALPGKKVLVLGNHDFDTNKMTYRNYHAFDMVTMAFSYPLVTSAGKICNVLVSHYPIDDKLLPDNTINVHGHIHDNMTSGRHVNISVEWMDYCPQVIDNQIEDIFTLYCNRKR